MRRGKGRKGVRQLIIVFKIICKGDTPLVRSIQGPRKMQKTCSILLCMIYSNQRSLITKNKKRWRGILRKCGHEL